MSGDPQIIVVGSGPAGVSAAWPLVRAGLQVLMIDASSSGREQSFTNARPGHWTQRFGADFGALAAPANISPKFATPLARTVLDGFAARNGLVTRNFFAVGSLAQGGLSKIWGALAEQFTAEEFAGFPFDATALASSYTAVRRRIGIACHDKDRPDHLSSSVARHVLDRHLRHGRSDGFELYAATNAVNETAMAGREACTRCGLCLFGCAGHSIYDSALELPALRRFANFAYRAGHFVQAIGSDGAMHVLDVETAGVRQRLRAPVVVMAAGTIATSHLILRFLNWIDRPVQLLSNPAAAAAFFAPRFVSAALPTEAFSLGQLFYRLRGEKASAAGVIYGADALPLDLFAARLPLSRPVALRLAHALAPALLITTSYLPGEFSRNFIRVHADGAEHRMSIEGAANPDAGAALRGVLGLLGNELRRLGALPVPGSRSILPPGADAHYAGVLPMGGDGPLATTAFGELKGHRNLFIADGSVLARLPATHPTLTIMANADRIGHEIARRLAAGANNSAETFAARRAIG